MPQRRGSDYYHKRARELRHAATEAGSSVDQETLLSFADDFDGLADEAEDAEEGRPRKATRR